MGWEVLVFPDIIPPVWTTEHMALELGDQNQVLVLDLTAVWPQAGHFTSLKLCSLNTDSDSPKGGLEKQEKLPSFHVS